MKALILAAGFGSRLAPLTDDCPKALVEVCGTPILARQIENLLENGITDISVIVGYKAEKIEAFVAAAYPTVKTIRADDYRTTNNMYSAWLGRDAMQDTPFLMMNADVYFDASVIAALLRLPAQDAIVVDVGAYMEESMKVIEKDGRLTAISKEISKEDALGASIDVYKFSPTGGKAFFAKCAEYIEDRKELKKWSEVALNDILPDVLFTACPLEGRWVEIDNFDDLETAKRLFGTP